MSENSISPINSVFQLQAPLQLETMSAHKLGAPARKKPAADTQPEPLTQVESSTALKPGAPAEPKPVTVDEKSTLPVNNGSNVTIHFRVDDETNELTVFVVDQKSKRVLRSIPASELDKLQAGDLLKLTA